MGRRAGSRNADFDATRAALVEKVAKVAAPELSFRELAAAAGVSPATLRHYFQDREGVLQEVLALHHRAGAPYLEATRDAEVGDAHEALSWLLNTIAAGWTHGLGAVHALGLGAGLGDERLGPSYVNEVLEPTLQAVEARLQRHIDSGELRPANVRHAALALLSPLVLGLLHQQGLFGARCRPLELGAFIDDHVEHFMRAYGTGARTRTRRHSGGPAVRGRGRRDDTR